MNYRISDFEKLTGVPRATLRYYDSLGVLSSHRDNKNNYRAYSELDLLRLVQLRQLNAFGIPLSALPAKDKETSCDAILDSLAQKREAIEASIEEMYQLLARVRLHETAYQAAVQCDASIQKGRSVGTYRIFLSSPDAAAHPNTPDILKKWLACTPHAYSVVRVRLSDLRSCSSDTCRADVGIGLLKNQFDSIGETFREPMQYSPVSACLTTMIETPDPENIPLSALEPLMSYIDEHSLIPMDDLYGWVVYAPVGESSPMYRISMRIAVNG
ncbi:MAG: MerR family transcriptional regulator [Clostridia bacterium]|nr:MerR family transcriptional regulator [Clostridia bacterium]